jgi:site-specific recombinase XerD
MKNDKGRIDRAVKALRRLSPERLEPILSLIEQLARDEGVEAETANYSRPVECIDTWVTKLRSERRSERTVEMYEYLARRFLAKVPDPTKSDIRAHLTVLLNGGMSPSAVENLRKALRSLFGFLREEGLRPDDPTDGLRAIKVPYMEKQPPSPEDVQKVLEVGFARAQDADKMRTVVTILMTTGLRLTECMSLPKQSIDLDKRQLMVVGKGRKRRVVPLVQMTTDTLKGYMERHPSDSPFLFPGKTKTGYAEIYNIEKTLRRACIRAGVKPFTPHQLRHYFATEMLKGGAKLEVVGRILGHSSIGITADIYRFVETGEMHEAVERFGPQNGATKERG